MSAYVEDPAHILALIRTATEGPSDPREVRPDNVWHGVRWFAVPDRELREINWQQHELFTRRLDWTTAEETCRLLFDENVASVRYRYSDADEAGMIPDADAFTMANIRSARRLSAIDALCAIRGLEYQSCEHPEWNDSEAERFLRAFERALISDLTRGSDCWSISSDVNA